ncbi:TPA: hypothetical protein NHP34_006075 [Pseudomonas aeruginosa]|nr:hypothetical protein [Pseudomonas aeruginosa]
MTNAPKGTGLAAFYQERFGSDPYALVDYFHDQISDAAADAYVDWSSICNAIHYNGERLKTYSKVKIKATDAKYNGKVMAWGDIKTARGTDKLEPFDYPFLTFSNNAANPSTWSGFAALAELYEREGGKLSDARHDHWKQQQEQRRAEREARKREDERLAREQAERIHGERMAYERAWLTGEAASFHYEQHGKILQGTVEVLGDEDGTAPYLVAKQIGAIASRFKMLRMRDRHGVFTAVPMHDIDGNFLGLQRLYADKKLQGTGVKMDGLHCVFGDLETAKRRYSAEGFATGASIYLAELEAGKGEDVAVVVTFNVDNLGKVLRAYAKRYPAWRFHNAADNDQWKDGNAGLLAALEIHRELKHPATVPHFDELGAELLDKCRAERKGPTDWNDYHVAFGLKATAKALRANASTFKAPKDWFEFCLERLPYSGKRLGEKNAMAAIAAGMMLSPIKYSYDQVVAAVFAQLPPGLDSTARFKIRSRAHWLAKQKLQQAKQLRGFSAAALARPNVQHLKVEGVRAEHGGIVLPEHMAALVESLQGVIIVRAPMGSGKTEKLIAPLMKASSKAAYVAHRISLLDDAAARLGVEHYKQVFAWQMPHVSHLACCVNSLTKPMFYNAEELSWFTTLETLCIDEASQVLRHTTTGPVEGRVKVMDALIDAVGAAERVLLCDADANDSLIEFCELARPGQPITVLEVGGSAEHIRIDHTDDESAWQLAIEQVKAGKRVLVANDSAESAKKMAALIEAMAEQGKIKPVRMLLVHADSKADQDVEAFLCNPNAEATKYDVLIYSPAISSGVSMTTPHFDAHFGLFSGNTVGPSDAIQMLRRDRTARRYIIGIGHASVQRETDRERIWRGHMKADEVACEFEETSDEIILRRRKTAFDHLYLATVTAENKARNNFANNLLLMLYAEGYNVQRLDVGGLGFDQDELTKASRSNRKAAGVIVFDKRMDLIESVETPSEEQFLKLSRQEVRSESESAQLDRYHMEHQLGVAEITADDVAFYDDRGIAKVVAMELLQADEEQARAYDKAQRKAKVTLTLHRWKTPAHAILCRVFEILGVDRFTGEGEFGSDQARQVLEYLTSSDDQVELYNALKLGRYIPSASARLCPTTLVKSIFDRLGLALQKRKTNGAHLFSVNPDNWQFIMAYCQRRAAKNVHSLTTHDHEATHLPKLAPEPQAAAQPAADAASSARDTLQCEGKSESGNYPLTVREKIFAVASRLAPPLGISLSRFVGALTPEVALGLAKPGAEQSSSLRHTLAYAAKLLRS